MNRITILLILLAATTLPFSTGRAQTDLQEQINSAAPGDTILVSSGTYQGPLHIQQSVTLLGEKQPHIVGNENDHVVHIDADRVTIEGFRISGSGVHLENDHAGVMVTANNAVVRNNHLFDVLHGIYVKAADYAIIAENRIEGPPMVTRQLTAEEARRHDCTVPPEGGACTTPLPQNQRGNGIHLWKSTHNSVTHNEILETRDGIYFSFADQTYAAHNRIHHLRFGLHYMYSDDNTFEHNEFYNNVSGSALMYSNNLIARNNLFRNNRSQQGYGLLVQTMENSRFIGNRLLQNGTGIYLENSTANVFEDNVVSANYRGLRITGSSMRNRFSQNTIEGNLHTAAIAGMSETNSWHHEGRGNFWGRRGLLDLTGDGVSELPFRTVDLAGDLRQEFPEIDLLAASPGLAILSEALRQVPALNAPTITDAYPLVQPPVRLTSDENILADPIIIAGLVLLIITVLGTVYWDDYRT